MNLSMGKNLLKKMLSLDSYQWLRNHQKKITYTGFIIVFLILINPFIQQARYKNKCILIANRRFLDESPSDNRMAKDSAYVLAYQVCNHRGT